MTHKMKVPLFLERFKQLYNDKKCFITRRKDEKINKLLREFGWTRQQMFEYLIDNLHPNDYDKGPEKDYNNPNGQVWVFKKEINDIYVYIKFSVFSNGLWCLSFHESEWGDKNENHIL